MYQLIVLVTNVTLNFNMIQFLKKQFDIIF